MVAHFSSVVLNIQADLTVRQRLGANFMSSFWGPLSLPPERIDLVYLSIGIWNKDAISFKHIFLGVKKELTLMH